MEITFSWLCPSEEDERAACCPLSSSLAASTLKEYGWRYPDAGYGVMFYHWLHSPESVPYNSFGNGSAMRVSTVGFAFPSLGEVLYQAERSAAVTHNHPEGIKGAQAIASAIFLARTGKEKREIAEYIEGQFGYNLHQTLDEIRRSYHFDETCQGSVPQADLPPINGPPFKLVLAT